MTENEVFSSAKVLLKLTDFCFSKYSVIKKYILKPKNLSKALTLLETYRNLSHICWLNLQIIRLLLIRLLLIYLLQTIFIYKFKILFIHLFFDSKCITNDIINDPCTVSK